VLGLDGGGSLSGGAREWHQHVRFSLPLRDIQMPRALPMSDVGNLLSSPSPSALAGAGGLFMLDRRESMLCVQERVLMRFDVIELVLAPILQWRMLQIRMTS
jgi:hypothetical protein